MHTIAKAHWTRTIYVVFLVLWMCALVSGGAVTVTAQPSGQDPIVTTGQNPVVTTGQNPGACPSGQLCNPLQSTTIQEFLLKIIDVLLTFAIPIIVFFIMYAGFKFVTARGNESQITEARTALTWAVVGGVIILSAKLIITVIQGTVNAL